jgi:hypothetical protein
LDVDSLYGISFYQKKKEKTLKMLSKEREREREIEKRTKQVQLTQLISLITF